MKQIYRIVLLCILCVMLPGAWALSQVDITATDGALTGSYASLGQAFAAINSGTHKGVITIGISGNTIESTTATLYQSGYNNTASYTGITIMPTGGAARSISGSISNNSLIELNGADNVTIDGQNSGGNSLTIENTSNSATARTIRFFNDATYLTLTNCDIKGSGTTLANGIITIGATTGSGNNNNIIISNCNIGPSGTNTPVCAIYSVGQSAALKNSNIKIINNNVFDFHGTTGAYGIYISTYNTGDTISGNSFYQTSSRTATPASAAYIIPIAIGTPLALATGSDNIVIKDNIIGGSSANAGGVAWSYTDNWTLSYSLSFIGICSNPQATGTTSIQNNKITNINWKTFGNFYGIATYNGNSNIGTLSGNTVGDTSGTTTAIAYEYRGKYSNYAAYGMYISTGTSNIININGNKVGSMATTINNDTSTGLKTAGIYVSTYGKVSATNNIIANIRSNDNRAASTLCGIYMTQCTTNVSGNTVRNLTTASGNISTDVGASLIGIGVAYSTSRGQNFSNNTIRSLTNINNTAKKVNVIGLYLSIGQNNDTVSKNIIYDLAVGSGASDSSTVIGMELFYGTMLVKNNVIRLGFDESGNAVTKALQYYGIYQHTNNNGASVYYNSIYLGGAATSSTLCYTYAYRKVGYFNTITSRNNIFVNKRTSPNASAKNFAYCQQYTNLATNNNNIYYGGTGNANVLSTDDGVTGISSINAWQAATLGQDMLSGIGNPNYSAPEAAAPSFSLMPSGSTPAESGATPIAGITDDYVGTIRNTTTPDIGAYEGNYTIDANSDIRAPQITYTKFINTSNTTADRSIDATITDIGVGLPLSGVNVPRIYYKNYNEVNWHSNPAVFKSGTANNGTWTFTIITSDMLPLNPGDSVQYYIYAQDQATVPNYTTNPTNAPTSYNIYKILKTYSGTYYIPKSGGVGTTFFNSFTRDGDFFWQINNGSVVGNITVVVNDSILIENGKNKLNQWLEENGSGYTLTIVPANATPKTVKCSTDVAAGPTPMIEFNGADNVTIDGSYNGTGQYLLFRNSQGLTSTLGPVIRFNNGVLNSSIKNCIIEGNSTANALVRIDSGANKYITIENNDLRNYPKASNGYNDNNYLNGIYGNDLNISLITIRNNRIHEWGPRLDVLSYGVYINGGDSMTVQNNHFYQGMGMYNTDQAAIYVRAKKGNDISGNYIGGSGPYCSGSPWYALPNYNRSFNGIYLYADTTVASEIQGNVIRNFKFWYLPLSMSAINVAEGKVNIGTTTPNIIGHPFVPDSGFRFVLNDYRQSSVTYSMINAVTNTQVNISNNQVYNVKTGSTPADPYNTASDPVDFRAISVNPLKATSSAIVNNNTIRRINMLKPVSTTYAPYCRVIYATGTGNVSITNNTIDSLEANGVTTLAGIYAASSTNNLRVNISNNSITNIIDTNRTSNTTLTGIYLANSLDSVRNNTISNITSVSPNQGSVLCSINGIYTDYSTAGNNSVIEMNNISGLKSQPISPAVKTYVCGLSTSANGNAAYNIMFRNNSIYDLENTNNFAGSAIIGFYNSSKNSWTLSNNQFSLTNDPNTNPVTITGIDQAVTNTGGGKFYFNSIYIAGTQGSGANNSYCFLRENSAAVTLADNLLVNSRVNTGSSTGSHFAIANTYATPSTGWSAAASDYNAIITSDAAKAGLWGATAKTFADWKTISSGDNNSISETDANVPALSLFNNPSIGDLNIKTGTGYDATPFVSNAGTPVAGITSDFGGTDTRSGSPDIGSDEFDVNRTLDADGSLLPASPNYPGNYDNIDIVNSASPTLAGNVNIFGLLNMNGGKVTTNSNVLTIKQSGSVTRTSGQVDGYLRKYVQTGTGVNVNYEIGSASDYLPVSLTFATVSGADYLTVNTVGTDHPNLGSAGIYPNKTANRYWTLSSGPGLAYDSYDATFNYAATDLDACANPSNLVLKRYVNPNWFTTNTGTRTTSSVQATAIAGLGDFAAGEPVGTITESWVKASWQNQSDVDSYGNPCSLSWGVDAFNKIQDGINAVIEGGTVHVLSGDYPENLALSKGIKITGPTTAPTANVNPASGNVITSGTNSGCRIENMNLVAPCSTGNEKIGVISGYSGDVKMINCTYAVCSTVISNWADVEAKILDGYDASPNGPGKFRFNNVGYADSSLALWLNTMNITNKNNNDLLDQNPSWKDQSGNGNDAYLPATETDRLPKFIDAYVDGYPVVKFTPDLLHTNKSDILALPISSTINTTGSKSLLIVFVPGQDMNSRQAIFEAGNSSTGFNVYISSGYLYFGMWSPVKRTFFSTPLTSGAHLAQLEYNGTRFRAIYDGSRVMSGTFSGLSTTSGLNALGGEAMGTRYHDYSIGSSYANFLDGSIAEVLLYNSTNLATRQSAFDYLNQKYELNRTYNTTTLREGSWSEYEDAPAPDVTDDIELYPPYPNPVSDFAGIGFRLSEKQNVSIEIFDAIGNKVATVFEGTLEAGLLNEFTIDAGALPSGVYIYRITGEAFTKSGKITVIK